MVRGLSILFSVAVFAAALVYGCQGDPAPYTPEGTTPTADDPFAPCTDPRVCCKAEEMHCTGDPDKGVVCSCPGLWDCSQDLRKCSTAISPPDGNGGWDCSNYNEFTGVTCEKPGTEADVPNGNGRWNCEYKTELGKVVCTESSPSNPSNNPAGAGEWNCRPTVTEGVPKLVCDRVGEPPPPGSNGPKGGGTWDCNSTNTVCTKKDADTLPEGGGNWRCHEETVGTQKFIVCTGESEGPPGGGGGWICEKMSNELSKYICRRPVTDSDVPPGGGFWRCVSGSEFSGRTCTKINKNPEPLGPYPTPGDICVPGTLRWCDGLEFCGWGVVTCLPDGSWPTREVNGKVMIDCRERADGLRPSTDCACYHFYYNPKCCETPDCVVPVPEVGNGADCTTHQDCGKNNYCAQNGKCIAPGQTCGPSGGAVCDYCNPFQPECQQGICAVSNSMETYCTQPCGGNGQCPQGMVCMDVSTKNSTSKQCIPADFSCYNGI